MMSRPAERPGLCVHNRSGWAQVRVISHNGGMEPKQRSPEETRKILRIVAVGLALWFLGSGIWGLLTETPQDRAILGCEAVALQRADADVTVAHTAVREESAGWSVTGEVRGSADDATKVTVTWSCTADADGKNTAITDSQPA